MKVAGRKTIVTRATVFIALLSDLVALLMSSMTLLSRWVILLYACVLLAWDLVQYTLVVVFVMSEHLQV